MAVLGPEDKVEAENENEPPRQSETPPALSASRRARRNCRIELTWMTQISCEIAGELCTFSPGDLGKTEVAGHRHVLGEAKVEGGVQLRPSPKSPNSSG